MLISVKYLFDVYFYVNLKNAVSLARFRSGFFMLQFVTSNSSISEKYYMHMGFFYLRTYIFSNELVYLAELWALYHAYVI